VVIMDGYVTPDIVDSVRALLDSGEAAEMMALKNFELGRRFFSYDILERRLRQTFMNFGQV